MPKIFNEAYIKINTITLFQIEMTQNPGYNVENQGISLSERALPSTPEAQVPEYLQLADYIETLLFHSSSLRCPLKSPLILSCTKMCTQFPSQYI